MSGPVVVGDVLVFPLASKTEITVKWSQMLKDRTEVYYTIGATNSSRGNTGVNMYVQKDIYDSQFASFAVVDGENGKATITDKFQYGQRDENGSNRYVVLHDTSRKPYQHRFVENTLQFQVGGYAKDIAVNLGYSTIANTVETFAKPAVGHYLHAF